MSKTIIGSKQNHHTFHPFSLNGHGGSGRFLKDHTFMFADLRGRVFDGLNLSNAEFFGCRLDGASFQRTCLHGARFIGCFSSSQSSPTDFTGSIWQNTSAIGCQLNYFFATEVPGFDCWPIEVVEAAEKTGSLRNNVRYEAVESLGALGNPDVAPYLATLLADEEWDVRLVALEALALLRQQKFPYRDQELMKQMFLSLGDEYAVVRGEAIALVQRLQPSDDVLRFSINRITKAEPCEKLAGLRAAAKLYLLSEDYSRLFSAETLHQLLSDESPLVRQECLHLFSLLDDPSADPWILHCLSDPVASVREQAIRTIGSLDFISEADKIEHLLHDPDPDVRLQTLYTLSNTDLLQPKHLEVALADSSPDVLRVARKYQASLDETDESLNVYGHVSPHQLALAAA